MVDCWYFKGANQESTKSTMMTVKAHASIAQGPPTDLVFSTVPQEYKPFLSCGYVYLPQSNVEKPVMILRDTGDNQSLLLEATLPLSEETSTGVNVLIQGVEVEPISVPLHRVKLQSDLVSGVVTVGIRPSLPVKGVDLILSNDLAGGKVSADPCVTNIPLCHDKAVSEDTRIYPGCAITRAMARGNKQKDDVSYSSQEDVTSLDSHDEVSGDAQEVSHKRDDSDPLINLSNTFMSHDPNVEGVGDEDHTPSPASSVRSDGDLVPRRELMVLHKKDPSLSGVWEQLVSEAEATVTRVCYYTKDGVLMRKWSPLDTPANDEWRVISQIVVPSEYRIEVLHLAHEAPMAGHLGINKTYQKIMQHFYWPGLKKDVKLFCRSCHTCQIIGKPNQKIPAAPLRPIPAFDEPFNQVLIDCVGPLPRTRTGNQYMLTVMCASTRFPEAIPLRNIRAATIVKHLIKFFTLVGLPKTVQSDQGSNFLAGIFQQVMSQLGIKQNISSAYHPQSQGALERFHQTLKTMLRAYCYEQEKDWDEGIPLLLFAIRESVQESLGFSPFELVYGREVRGPLKLLKEHWLEEEESGNLSFLVTPQVD